ncbi:translocation/assembly module TamB domain-containing protein [Thermus caldifontis]|uniref:translocation/assembly module TamB domain-containing protein n=1 Tax=Thermus caldifontis TaxID=1930763 RepID=UPI000DF1316C|nr:translocation/assembly module TamB domain-containing protein [Thermus caldifontis]
MRWGLSLLLGFILFLILLLAWPPLLRKAVERGMALAGFRGEVREVGGHLLLGLRLKGVRLQGEGVALEAEEVRLGYDLLGLLRKELPLSLAISRARITPTWEALIPKKPGPPPAIRTVFRQLRLEEVQVELPKGKRLFLPPLRLTLSGKNPYAFLARLPGGSFRGEARALAPDLSAWEVGYRGEVRGLSFFYQGLKGGRLSGVFRLLPSGVEGEAQVEGGVVELVGFTLTQVAGPIRLREDRVEAELRGRGLEGPLSARVEVDLRGERYRFSLEGRPTLPALARHYRLSLPVEGDGELWLEGEGWDQIRVQGRFVGEGRLLGEPFRHRGTLSFDRVFRLDAKAEGKLFDRTYRLGVGLVGQDYRASLEDSLGSRLSLKGQGNRTEAQGQVAWPKPLEGLAQVAFRSQGSRWQARVESPGVRLPFFLPLDLSGEVVGEGDRVEGRLGPLALGGSWSQLGLRLAPTPLQVGRLEGEGRLLGGRLQARLRYNSPYTAFPLEVWQEGGAYRFQTPHGEGVYRGGALALSFRGLPIRALDEFRLSGQALYREGGLSGRLSLRGRYLEAEGRLRRLGTEVQGRLLTPLGELPFAGAYDPEPGLVLRAQDLLLRYQKGLSLKGRAELGPLALQADLAWDGGFRGHARVESPWLAGVLKGEGGRLRLLGLEGYAEGQGEVYPQLEVRGQLKPPWPEGLEVPVLSFHLDRRGLEVEGVGRLDFAEGFPFHLDLPWSYRGLSGRFQAVGTLEGGRLSLSLPWGRLEAQGAWRDLGVRGQGEAPYVGAVGVTGRLDLLGLSYRAQARLGKPALTLSLVGQGVGLRFFGQAPGLRILGGYEKGLSLLLQAEGFDLSPWGLPVRARGTWGTRGGSLRLESPYGEALLTGKELLSARARLLGPYFQGEGRVSPEGLFLALRGAYQRDGVALRWVAEGGGPWRALSLELSGEAGLPYLGALPLSGRVWTEGGSLRYRLQGPIALEGEGLSYRGSFTLPFAAWGREGRLQGSFQGQGLRVEGEGEGRFAGLAFAFRGGFAEVPSLALDWEGGRAGLRGEEVRFVLEEVAPLAEALGFPLSGRAEGRLSLRGEGEVWAQLRYGKEPLALDYREGVVRLLLPERDLGLAWNPKEGWLGGLGKVSGEGRLRLGPGLKGEVEGDFRYGSLELGLRGPWEALSLEVLYRGEGLGETAVRGRVNLLALKGEGVLRHASPYGEGVLTLAWEGARYWGEGRFKSLRFLEQEGPLRLEGEGARAHLAWQAPLALGVRYDGAWHLWAKGEGEVEGMALRADLTWGPEGYLGEVWAEGHGLALKGKGEGPLRLTLEGRGLPGEARGEATLEGLLLSGKARYRLELGQARLEAQGAFQAGWPEALRGQPWGHLEGQGSLLGKGEALPFRFAYRYRGGPLGVEALSLVGEAEGFRLGLAEGHLVLDLDRDLTPFGVPVRLKAQGDGPWPEALEVRLERPEGWLSGKAWPWPLRAELSGEVLGERVRLRYGDGEVLGDFQGPRLRGEARYRKGLSGLLALRYPLPQGGIAGGVDLGAGTFQLKGEGAWRGGLEGRFCLPAPLGGCPGLEGEVRGGLAHGEYAFTGSYAYRAKEGYLGEVFGEGRVSSPYGGVLIRGAGLGLDLMGEGLPLEGRLDLHPFRLAYRYAGALPRGLGELWAEGVYPGEWLGGRYRYGEVELGLVGLPGFQVEVSGKGVSGRLGPEGPDLVLQGFTYGPLSLSGKVAGPWREVGLDLSLKAFGRQAQAQGRYGEEGLVLAFQGDLEGEVDWKEAWRGRLAFKEGSLELSGKGLPQLSGEVLGERVLLAWPLLQVGGVRLDLASRRAEGEGRVLQGLLPGGLAVRGEGEGLKVGYRVPGLDLPLEGRLDLKGLSLLLVSPEGEGALRYAGGRVEGSLALRPYGFPLRLEGEGERVRLMGEHPAFPWWVAGAGSLEGEVDLSGAYRLTYRAGEQVIRLSGKLLQARLEAQGPYLAGALSYPAAGELRVDLPLPPLESRFRGRVFGEGYGVEGVLEGSVGRITAKGKLLPLAGEVRLERANLEDFAGRYAPYLKGWVSGNLAIKGLEAQAQLEGEAGVSGTRLPLRFLGLLARGGVRGEGRLGESAFRVDLEGERLDLAASPRGFPLHLLLMAVAGPLEGEAYWTGAVRLRLPLSDPLKGEGVLVGEALRFVGAGDELRGQAVLRLEGGRVHVDRLSLSGRGSWEGGGYWGKEGSDLYLSLKDTVFTPVLQVVPALKPYRPEGSGSLLLRLRGDGFQAEFRDFRFRLGPVAGYLPQGLLSLNGGAKAEGELTLLAPFPGRARLGLEGRLEDFRVSAKGAVSLPGLKEETPAEVAFRYPGYGVEIQLGEAQAQGTLFPLRLAGYGRLPLAYPQYYLQEGLLDVKSFFLYEEKGTYHLTGNAEVLRARLALPEAQTRQLSREGVALQAPTGKPTPVPLVFEGVRVYAERGILVQESLAQGELKGEVFLGGSYGDPFLAGEVRSLWGSFRLWDSLFALDPGESALRFRPDRGLLPEFGLKALAETRGYKVILQAKGEFLRENGRVKVRLEPQFTSDPPLSEPEIYALLTLGTPDVTRLAETLPQVALGAALENLVLGQLERELTKALGLDRFQVQVPLLQGGDLGDVRFSVGKYLSPELFLGYEVDLRGQQTLSAQYRRDGLTFSLASTFLPGDGRLSRFTFALGYDLTPALGLSFSLEAADATRFSVGALYRW